MPHKIDLTGTPIVKPKTHRLVFEDGKFKVISNRIALYESREVSEREQRKAEYQSGKKILRAVDLRGY